MTKMTTAREQIAEAGIVTRLDRGGLLLKRDGRTTLVTA